LKDIEISAAYDFALLFSLEGHPYKG
jgi:hypothetical protein